MNLLRGRQVMMEKLRQRRRSLRTKWSLISNMISVIEYEYEYEFDYWVK